MNRSSFYLLNKEFNLEEFIRKALHEDIKDGDHTSLATIPFAVKRKAALIVKEDGVIAGIELAKRIFFIADKKLILKIKKNDGAFVKKGDIVLVVEGNARSILKAERVVLNCMQRMSGIATFTRELSMLCKHGKTKILDTRKTTPLFREIEKWAVRIGGGCNHRFGLYDMILIKNNHIDFSGGVKNAIVSANNYIRRRGLNLEIEIEARNIKEVKEILETGNINRILLDNFSVAEIKEALWLINKKYKVEISGGINRKNIRKYASLGADYISIGALTHSVKSLDISLSAIA